MRSQQSLCLFCRNIKSTEVSKYTYVSRRFASSRRGEPYVLSRLVIDLDAADSKFVKRAEDLEPQKEDQAPTDKESSKGSGDSFARTNASKKGRSRKIFNELRVTSHDLLSYAFLGDINPRDRRHNEMQHVNASNSVYPFDNLNTKFDQLLSAFSRDSSKNLKLAGFDKVFERDIAEQLTHDTKFWRLRRMISVLSSTQEGCQFILDHEFSVLDAIRTCYKVRDFGSAPGSSTTDDEILWMLNNLSVNIRSKSLRLGEKLSKRGYSIATSLHNTASMRLYSPITAQFKDILHANQGMSLARALKHLGASNEVIVDEVRKHYMDSGNETADTELDGNQLKSRIDSEKKRKLIDYPMFLCVLGSLGLKEELWSEWIASDTQAAQPKRTCRAQMFATALVLANDHERALTILDSAPEEEKFVTSNRKAPSFKLDIFKLASTSVDNPSIRLRMYIFIRSYYTCHKVVMGPKLQRVLWSALGNMPTESIEVLDVIERFLMTDTPEWPSPKTPFTDKARIEWAELKGRQGLLVTDLLGDLIYWKATTEAVDVTNVDATPDLL